MNGSLLMFEPSPPDKFPIFLDGTYDVTLVTLPGVFLTLS